MELIRRTAQLVVMCAYKNWNFIPLLFAVVGAVAGLYLPLVLGMWVRKFNQESITSLDPLSSWEPVANGLPGVVIHLCEFVICWGVPIGAVALIFGFSSLYFRRSINSGSLLVGWGVGTISMGYAFASIAS